MIVATHILGRDFTCARCSMDFKGLEISTEHYVKMKRGDRLGVISGLRFTTPSAYLITQHEYDSNKVCAP